MDTWGPLLDVASSVYLFALGTQCALSWIFALLFLSFNRAAEDQRYFRSWTWAWIARATALTAILVRFSVPALSSHKVEFLDGTLFSTVSYSLYQLGKLLSVWWLLEGVLVFAEVRLSRRSARWIVAVVACFAIGSVPLMGTVENMLLVQAPVIILASLAAAVILVRVPAHLRSAGTRLTAGALALQALLWCAYTIALNQQDHGPWPLVQTPWTILAAHNSYFDLALDVMIAAGLVVLLLQDVHRRQLATEEERNGLRAELERTERLRSLGTLVSGVAHELNNPLTAILGFAEAMGLEGLDRERIRQLNVIREQALRCRRIVRGLATFSGKGSEIHEPVEFHELLERVSRGFEFELQCRRVKVAIDAPESAEMLGDRFALEQMVANLLSNALQSSPPGTTVTLGARGLPNEIVLTVEDEGPGFPQEALGRAFDPFFTTRMPGEGMGLGLAVVHGVVNAHGGSVRAENQKPHGARLTVTLPRRIRGARTEHEPLPIREIPRPVRKEGAPLELLVIDDEPLLREMMQRIGVLRGWRVTVAATGGEGLQKLRELARRFDAILCDLRMPSPSGIEVHDRLQDEAPEILERFLFITGNPHGEEARAFARRCTRPILGKPFDTGELALRIEELAARRAPIG